MRQDQPEQALHEYQRAAGLEPDNPAWRVSIGEAYSLSGDLQAALQSYLEAIEMAPSQASYLRLLADFCAHYDVQVEEYGLPAAQAALELSPDDPLVQDTLGWTLVKLERYSEAQDALEHALSLEPELALPHLHLGMLALYQDDWEAARDHLRQALELDPDGPVGEQAKGLLDQYFP
jgi:tetratricopeptide (TPR) repeat protein